jgi:serine/threonine protein kinase
MVARLVLAGPNGTQAYILSADTAVIGRSSACQVVIPVRGVSRKHAVILRIHGSYFIEDMHSRNGTFVNDLKITARTALDDRYRISIAGNHLTCHKGEPSFPQSPSVQPQPTDLPDADPQPENNIGSAWKAGDWIENRWEVQQILGGRMGIIYVVLDHETGELLAAKTYRDDVLEAHPELPKRFEREAHAWINLGSHPNIVQAKYVKTVQHRPFLFLEFVAGGNLRSAIPSLLGDKNDFQRLSTIQDLALHFCDGMIHAAQCGITAHRDIKAENCLVWERSEEFTHRTRFGLKITDFGLAKVFDEAAIPCDTPHIMHGPQKDNRIPVGAQGNDAAYHAPVLDGVSVYVTRTGVAAGTPSHMAPEQFGDVKHVDTRADIYAFGVMLFRMVAGRLPFTGRTCLAYRRLHQSVEAPDLDTEYATLDALVARCLAKNPAERFADFLEVRKELERAVYDHGWSYLRGDLPSHALARPLTDQELLDKARSLAVLRQYQQALQAFNLAIEKNPTAGRAWVERGLLLMNVFRRFEEALNSLCQAERLGERSLEDYIVECRKHLNRGEPEHSG